MGSIVDADVEYDGENAAVDLVQVVVAHYFDSIYDEMLTDLEAHTRKLLLSLPVFFPSTLHLGPVFMHQDDAFLRKYSAQFPCQSLPTGLTKDAESGVSADAVDIETEQRNIKQRLRALQETAVKDVLDKPKGDKILLDLALRFLKNSDETEKARLVST